MRTWLKITIWLAVGLLLILLIGGFSLYKASQQVPEFYRVAVETDSKTLESASHKMEQRITALASDVQKEGHWQAVFTADQINGWLAHKLSKEFPGLDLKTFRDPRVAVSPQTVILAFRHHDGMTERVISLSGDVYLDKPNVIAVRVRSVRAGLLPLPLDEVLQQITTGTRQLDLPIEWRQADGDPVALITIPEVRDKRNKVVHLETLRLGDSEIYVAGDTRRGGR